MRALYVCWCCVYVCMCVGKHTSCLHSLLRSELMMCLHIQHPIKISDASSCAVRCYARTRANTHACIIEQNFTLRARTTCCLHECPRAVVPSSTIRHSTNKPSSHIVRIQAYTDTHWLCRTALVVLRAAAPFVRLTFQTAVSPIRQQQQQQLKSAA